MDQKTVKIAKKIQNAGGKLYLVGGAVRDELLNRPVKDRDFCVVGIDEEEFQKLFPEAKKRGKAFPVYEIEKEEYALARKEWKCGIGHTGFEVISNKDITIEEDLARRDITINAMAQEIITGKIIDPFYGQEDLKNKKIRAIKNNFIEDPLRVYRVARLASVLEFEVDDETIEKIKKMKKELGSVAKERIGTEFTEALSSSKPSVFFEVLKKADVLEVHFKEIADLIGSIQPIKYHPEGDSYAHTMQALDISAKYTKNLCIRFSVLVHDLGKGITPKEEYPHHYGHDRKGVPLVATLGNRIGIPQKWITCGKTAAKLHMKAGIFFKMTAKKQVDFLEECGHSPLGWEGMKIVVIADKNEQEEVTFPEIGEKCFKAINGNDIMEKYPKLKGKKIGEKVREERILWMKK